jgi:hypothetical protein
MSHETSSRSGDRLLLSAELSPLGDESTIQAPGVAHLHREGATPRLRWHSGTALTSQSPGVLRRMGQNQPEIDLMDASPPFTLQLKRPDTDTRSPVSASCTSPAPTIHCPRSHCVPESSKYTWAPQVLSVSSRIYEKLTIALAPVRLLF